MTTEHRTDVRPRSDGFWVWDCNSCASRGVWFESQVRAEAAEHTRHRAASEQENRDV